MSIAIIDNSLATVKLKSLRKEARLPRFATPGSAGVDLHAAIEEDINIPHLKRVLIPCGFAMELPQGFEAQIRPRSGLALKHGITVLNTPGTIDSDYRGEVMVCLINFGDKDFVIEDGMRIAQMIVSSLAKVEYVAYDKLSNTERSSGGFGSTGR